MLPITVIVLSKVQNLASEILKTNKHICYQYIFFWVECHGSHTNLHLGMTYNGESKVTVL